NPGHGPFPSGLSRSPPGDTLTGRFPGNRRSRMRCHSAGLLFAVAAALAMGLAVPASAQLRGTVHVPTRVSLSQVTCPRIADPKLETATIPIGYVLQPPGVRARVSINLVQNGQRVATLFEGEQVGSDLPHVLMWDGRLPAGGGAATGGYAGPGGYT